VASCNVPAVIPVEGRIVETGSGRPVAGVGITVIGGDGVDTVRTSTDSDGIWRAVFQPGSAEPLTVDVVVAPRGRPSYRVDGVELRAFTRRGESNLLDSWVDRPNFPVLGEIHVRGTRDERADSVRVFLTQTGGAALSGDGVQNGRYTAITNVHGHFLFPGPAAFAAGLEPIVVDLEIEMPPAVGNTIHRGVRIAPSYVFRDRWRLVRLGAGPSIDYVVEFRSTTDGKPVEGVEIEFLRTDGIMVTPLSDIQRSTVHGHASLRYLQPLARGVVIGDMWVRPPPPARPYYVQRIHLPTFDSDHGRLLGVWLVGPDHDGPGDGQRPP
jgi:hypothetical protein